MNLIDDYSYKKDAYIPNGPIHNKDFEECPLKSFIIAVQKKSFFSPKNLPIYLKHNRSSDDGQRAPSLQSLQTHPRFRG